MSKHLDQTEEYHTECSPEQNRGPAVDSRPHCSSRLVLQTQSSAFQKTRASVEPTSCWRGCTTRRISEAQVVHWNPLPQYQAKRFLHMASACISQISKGNEITLITALMYFMSRISSCVGLLKDDFAEDLLSKTVHHLGSWDKHVDEKRQCRAVWKRTSFLNAWDVANYDHSCVTTCKHNVYGFGLMKIGSARRERSHIPKQIITKCLTFRIIN